MRSTWRRGGLVVLSMLLALALVPETRGDDKDGKGADGVEKRAGGHDKAQPEEEKAGDIGQFMQRREEQELALQRQAQIQTLQERNAFDSSSTYESSSELSVYEPVVLLWANPWYGYPWFGFVGPFWGNGDAARARQTAGTGNVSSPPPASTSGGGNTTNAGATAPATAGNRALRGDGASAGGAATRKVHGTPASSSGTSIAYGANQSGTRGGKPQGVTALNARQASPTGRSGVNYAAGRGGSGAANTLAMRSRGGTGITYSPHPGAMGQQGVFATPRMGGFQGGLPLVQRGGMGGMQFGGGYAGGVGGMHYTGGYSGGMGGMHYAGGYPGAMGGMQFAGGHGGGHR